MSMNSPDRPRIFYREHLEQGMLGWARAAAPLAQHRTRTEEKSVGLGGEVNGNGRGGERELRYGKRQRGGERDLRL